MALTPHWSLRYPARPMKRNKTSFTLPLPRPLILKLEHLRIISGGGDLQAPPQTNGSSAPTCQGTKFECCLV